MTWGSHCDNCGREKCGWVNGRNCEGSTGIKRPARKIGIIESKGMAIATALIASGAVLYFSWGMHA